MTIDYALPSGTITAGVAQRITKCPASAEVQADEKETDPELGIEFAYKVAIAGRLTPTRLVRLDAESGFLVDRETKVHFAEDWYLKDFNGKTTGQGGPLLVSLIKAGVAIYAMGANPILGAGAAMMAVPESGAVPFGAVKSGTRKRHYSSKHYLECQPAVTRNLDALERRRSDVSELELRVIRGDSSPATQDVLTLRRAQVGDLEAALTINATLKGGLTPGLNADGTVANLAGQIAPADIARWFQVKSIRIEVKTPRLAVVEAAFTVADRQDRTDGAGLGSDRGGRDRADRSSRVEERL